LDLLAFEATGHSKFNFPIPIQLASVYDRVEAINSTQKQWWNKRGSTNAEQITKSCISFHSNSLTNRNSREFNFNSRNYHNKEWNAKKNCSHEASKTETAVKISNQHCGTQWHGLDSKQKWSTKRNEENAFIFFQTEAYNITASRSPTESINMNQDSRKWKQFKHSLYITKELMRQHFISIQQFQEFGHSSYESDCKDTLD